MNIQLTLLNGCSVKVPIAPEEPIPKSRSLALLNGCLNLYLLTDIF